MQNFTFHNPTKIIFGKDTVPLIGKEAARYGTRALVLSGMGSAKASGVYAKALDALKKNSVSFVEVDGIVSNPVLSKVREAIRIAKHQDTEMIVAIGGGSVLDTAKTVAAGAVVEHDVWDFFLRKETIDSALPVLDILTLAATGSEMNGGAVITNGETQEKFSASSIHMYPKVSILDPTTTFSVSPAYSAFGAVDTVVHLLEPYFNNTASHTTMKDGMIESLIRTIIDTIDEILENPHHYPSRATMMWSATMALNGITSAGYGKTSFPVHMIEHSLSALYNVPHGAGLSIVLSGWLQYMLSTKTEKIAQLGKNCFFIHGTDEMAIAQETIEAVRAWFQSINSPTKLSDYNIAETDIPTIAENALLLSKLWDMQEYSDDEIATVLHFCK